MAANPQQIVQTSTIDAYQTLMDVAWNFDLSLIHISEPTRRS